MADLSGFPELDLVVITGDNVNDARPEEYAVLAGVLAELTVPYVILPGNHDDRGHLRALVHDRPYADPDLLYHVWQKGACAGDRARHAVAGRDRRTPAASATGLARRGSSPDPSTARR